MTAECARLLCMVPTHLQAPPLGYIIVKTEIGRFLWKMSP